MQLAGIYRLSSGLSLNKCVELESDGAENDGCLCQAAGLCFPVREHAFLLFITDMMEKLNAV